MGVDIHTKSIKIREININLQIWDFVGEIRFRNLIPTYARGSFGGIFMYDITNLSSIKNLDSWLNTLKEKLPEWRGHIPVLLVGGKSDLSANRIVTNEDVVKSSKNQIIYNYIECSSKTGDNVETVFYDLTLEILKRSKII